MSENDNFPMIYLNDCQINIPDNIGGSVSHNNIDGEAFGTSPVTELANAISVDIGPSKIRMAVIRKDGKIITPILEVDTPPNDLNGCICSLASALLAIITNPKNGRDIPIKTIGISVVGFIDYEKGEVMSASNIPSLINLPIRNILSNKFWNLPTWILTDCKAAVIGEYYYGEGQRANTVAYVTFSSGIGVGVLSNGEILFGTHGNAGELGHTIVDTTHNLRCGCGGFGHWEAYASGVGIPNFFKSWIKNLSNNSTGTDIMLITKEIIDNNGELDSTTKILDAAKDNSHKYHKLVSKFMGELAKINACGLVAVCFAYDPDLIILDGSIMINNPEFVKEIKKEVVCQFDSMKVSRMSSIPINLSTLNKNENEIIHYSYENMSLKRIGLANTEHVKNKQSISSLLGAAAFSFRKIGEFQSQK